MAGLESRGTYRRERMGVVDGRENWERENWRELLPDLLWPALLAVAILMVVGLVL